MMTGYIVFGPTTGVIFRIGTCDPEDVQHQARDGEAVLAIDPAVPVDPACQRINVDTGTLIDWQPPAPADDDWRTWSWSVDAKRWQPQPTAFAIATEVRATRDTLLAQSDWVTVRATDLGQPVPAAWAAYRQALREVPDQLGFPHTITWPEPPGNT